MNRRTRIIGMNLVASLTLVVACSEEGAQSKVTAVPAVAPPAAAKVNATADASNKPVSTWSYSPVGKRDPFRSYLADLAEQATRPDDERRTEETEKYELDQYRLTGLITGTAQPKAMVEDPAGKGHVLHLGSHLGKRGGRVTRIGNDLIVVTEEIRAPTGERVLVPINIRLPKPELGLDE